jgi:hypothetical protein
MKRLIVGMSVALVLTSLPTYSATPPKAGATCSKLGSSTTYQGKKFTCIKSGKKMIWNKGIAVKSSSSQTSPITPKPTPTPNSTLSSVSSICGSLPNLFTSGIERISNSEAKWSIQVSGVCSYLAELETSSGKKWTSGIVNTASSDRQIIEGRFKELNCFPQYKFRVTIWSEKDGKGKSIVSISSQLVRFCQPDSSVVAKEGANCFKVGDRVQGETTYLECRWVKGQELVWIKLSKKPESFINPASPQNVDICKIKGEIEGNAILGFGPDFSARYIPPTGVNRSLIVPIDFPDIPGEANFLSRMLDQRKKMMDWVKYYSAGKLDFQVDYLDSWVRTPLPSAEYDLYKFQGDLDKRTAEGNETTRKYAQKYVDLITNKVNLQNYQTIYIFYPAAQKAMRDFVPRVQRYQVKEGIAVLSVFAIGDYDLRMGTPYFSFWIHETGHDWGLKGHSPGDGWPLGIMTNQAGFSLNLSGWEQFLLSWLPDEQVFCNTKENLKVADVKLSPLQREDKQTKIITIVLDTNSLLVVESHGIDSWTNRRLDTQFYNFDQYGFYGVVAYIVSTKSTGGLVRDAGGANLPFDDGNNDSLPRQAKFYPIVGESSNFYGLNKLDSTGAKTNDPYIAVEGDYFEIEGIKITFVKSGDYNTVRVEKTSS